MTPILHSKNALDISINEDVTEFDLVSFPSHLKAPSGMLPGPGIPDPLRILQDVLQLTDKDIADRLDNSRPLTAYALFKIWKEKPRQSVFNYRAVLALEIRRTGMPDLADKIIAGIKTKRV